MNNEKDFLIRDGVLIKYVGSKTEVTVPEGVEVIGWRAFSYANHKIKSIILPKSLRVLRYSAFGCCDKLERVTFLGVPEYIDINVFGDVDEWLVIDRFMIIAYDLAIDDLLQGCYTTHVVRGCLHRIERGENISEIKPALTALIKKNLGWLLKSFEASQAFIEYVTEAGLLSLKQTDKLIEKSTGIETVALLLDYKNRKFGRSNADDTEDRLDRLLSLDEDQV